MTAAQFWEERYAGTPRVWSGRVNAGLVELTAGLPVGRALDLGCGEGGDALWLARQGWQVTAVDISATALARGRAAAAEAGLPEDRIRWVAHDLTDWQPEQDYDLVSAFFLQSPMELPRREILHRAAASVAPGGHVLVVSHAAPPPWARGHDHHPHHSATPSEEVEALGLSAGEWEVVVAEVRHREAIGPDGQPASLEDSIVLARRVAGERDVAARLRDLEPIFHRSPSGSGREVFEAMLVPDFWEVGASGQVYEREFVLATVAQRYADGVAEGSLEVSDFVARRLAGDTWLVTYDLDQDGRRSRRSTIWTLGPQGWQAVYHQGTLRDA